MNFIFIHGIVFIYNTVSSSKIVFNYIYKYHLFDENAEKHSLASLQRALRGSAPLVALATDIYACHVGKRGVLRVGTRLPVTPLPLPVENNAITGDLIGIFCEYFTLKFYLTHQETLWLLMKILISNFSF